jgi:hypothetical protein
MAILTTYVYININNNTISLAKEGAQTAPSLVTNPV